jgi:hypothetical protein
MSAPELTAAEKRELAELAAMKKEFKAAGYTRKHPPNRDNLLMKKMGADMPYRYDAFPPHHYLFAFRHAQTAREKTMSWCYMGTIALGRNSPFVVDEHGNALDVIDLAAACWWSIKMAERQLLSAEEDGLLRRDPEIRGKRRDEVKRRIWVCAKVGLATVDSKGVTGNEEPVQVPTPLSSFMRCEPYLKRDFEALPLVLQSETLVRHLAIQTWSGEAEADGLAAVRTIREHLEYHNWTHAGIKLRDPRQKTRKHPAQFNLDNQFRITAGHLHVDLAESLPDGVRPPDAPADPATNGNRIEALRRHWEALNKLWLDAPDGREDAIRAVMDAIEGHIDALEESAQSPPPPLLEAMQAPGKGIGASENEDHIHAKKSNVHDPTSLLPSPTPQNVVSREAGLIGNSVSKSATDLPTKPATQPPRPRPNPTPPMKAAAPPGSTGRAPDAIPSPRQAETRPTPAARSTEGRRTGLAGTPSIDHRLRLSEISRAIPDAMARQCQSQKTPDLLRRIDEKLPSAPVAHFRAKLDTEWASRPEYFTSLGLCIRLAEDVERAWTAGAEARAAEGEKAERTRKRHEELEAKQVLLAEYSRHTQAAAEKLYNATSAVKLGAWEIEKQAILKMDKNGRNQSRWSLMAPDARAREVRQMILLDLGKQLPTFDEWAKAKTKGAAS